MIMGSEPVFVKKTACGDLGCLLKNWGQGQDCATEWLLSRAQTRCKANGSRSPPANMPQAAWMS